MSSNNHAGSTEEYSEQEAKGYFMNGFVILALLVAGILVYSFTRTEPEPEPAKTSPFSEDCTFYKKIQGGDFVLSEPKAGTYRYEIYATSEGIEVWKCNNF